MLTVRRRWDDWVPQERIRKLTEENKELASNLKKDMDAQRRAATIKPASMSTKKRAYGSDLTGSSARGSEDRSSAVPQAPRGTKRGKEVEGIDKVRRCLPSLRRAACVLHADRGTEHRKKTFSAVRLSASSSPTPSSPSSWTTGRK